MFCVDEVIFTERSDFEEHLDAVHDESLLKEDIPSVAEMSCQRKMTMPEVCPVCACEKSASDEEHGWIDHICKCLHDFSQRSLPWNDHAYKGRTTIEKQEVLPDDCPLQRFGKTEFGDHLFYRRLPNFEAANLDKESHDDSVQSNEVRHNRVDTWHMTDPMGTLVNASTSPKTPPPPDESIYARPDHVAPRPETPTRELDLLECLSADTKASDDESSHDQWEGLSDDKYFDDRSVMASFVLGSPTLSSAKIRSLQRGLSESARLLGALEEKLMTFHGKGRAEDKHSSEKNPGLGHRYSNILVGGNVRVHSGDSFVRPPTYHTHAGGWSEDEQRTNFRQDPTQTRFGDQAKRNSNEAPELHVRHHNKEKSDRDLTPVLDLVSKISSSLQALANALELRSAHHQESWMSAVYLLIVDLESAQIMQSATSKVLPCSIRLENPLHLFRLCIVRYAPDLNSPAYINYMHKQLTGFSELIEVALEKDWR